MSCYCENTSKLGGSMWDATSALTLSGQGLSLSFSNMAAQGISWLGESRESCRSDYCSWDCSTGTNGTSLERV